MKQPLRVLYCHCTYAKVVPDATKAAVLQALSESDIPFEAVPDLCEMSANQDPCLKQLVGDGDLKIAACYPRAVKWLFHAVGVTLPETVQVMNMRTETPEAIITALNTGGEQ
jgi:hypothetical protein